MNGSDVATSSYADDIQLCSPGYFSRGYDASGYNGYNSSISGVGCNTSVNDSELVDSYSDVPGSDHMAQILSMVVMLNRTNPSEYAIPVNGYVSPILIFLTIINNSWCAWCCSNATCAAPPTPARRHGDLGHADGVFPVPIFIHFFGTDRFWEYCRSSGVWRTST
ncbi:hypothetical protein C0Q70_12487 [Pomacea canaliculata]|uniref:Uncharacterized protein n=1 Tax=Pomacea canaliculata TaxID=400727 RepID=A0A2T7P1P5_POMCA|nr:hypothetical protein C0Q70_12487 [Pomacea canaliculata]